jgi:hypothetical protein
VGKFFEANAVGGPRHPERSQAWQAGRGCFSQSRALCGCTGGRRLAPAATCDTANAWEDGGLALRGDARELLKAVSSDGWFPTSDLADGKPRVVHPAEMKERGFCMAGKEQHWVCGAAASERIHVEGLQKGGGFEACPMPRDELKSLPEGALGENYVSMTSASEWEDLKQRLCSLGRGMPYAPGRTRGRGPSTSSGPWRALHPRRGGKACSRFWKGGLTQPPTCNEQRAHRGIVRLEVQHKSRKDF